MFYKLRKYYSTFGLKETILLVDRKYGFGRLEFIWNSNWFNPFYTLWLNFRSFPLSQAWKLPFWVYGHPRFYSLSGSMRIEGKIKCGMIKFNLTRPGGPSFMSLPSEIYNLGEIIFKGYGYFGTGNKIFVNYRAKLILGENFEITDMINIGCMEYIKIGDRSSITHRCQILDSNYHYVADFVRNYVPNRTKPIVINNGCWIGNSTTITGGVNLPPYTIVASNSLVNQTINNTVPENSIIGGLPAKLIKTGVRRIYNKELNRLLNQHFVNGKQEIFRLSEEWTMSKCSKE